MPLFPPFEYDPDLVLDDCYASLGFDFRGDLLFIDDIDSNDTFVFKPISALERAIRYTLERERQEELNKLIRKQIELYFTETESKKPKNEIITQIFEQTQLYLDTFYPEIVEYIEENPDTSKISALITSSIAPYVADKVSGVGMSIIISLITLYINLVILRIIDVSPKRT